MALIYTGTKAVKPVKKKPGWREAQRENAEWLAKWVKPGDGKKPNSFRPLKLAKPVIDPSRLTAHIPSMVTPPKQVEPTIHDPRVLYKDSPDLVERELKARERKFTTAPVYNKGGDVLITDEMMKDIMSGATRRRS